MPRFFQEILIITTLTVLGAAFSLSSGLAPLPWAEPTLAAGEIRLGDARAVVFSVAHLSTGKSQGIREIDL